MGSQRQRNTPTSYNDAVPQLEEERIALKSLVDSHIGSMNQTVDVELPRAVKGIRTIKADLGQGLKEKKPFYVSMSIERVRIQKPMKIVTGKNKKSLYPSDCRAERISYGSPMSAVISIKVPVLGTDDVTEYLITKKLGDFPVMVGSSLCNLENADSKTMVKRKEDAVEVGGYFICNGNERVIRLLQMPKANFIHALQRPSFKKRGNDFTDRAVSIRCLGIGDLALTAQTVNVHYKKDGNMVFRVSIRKSEYFIPVVLILKALKGPMCTDREIFTYLMRGFPEEMRTRIIINLKAVSALECFTSEQCLQYIGSSFRKIIGAANDDDTDEEVGRLLIDNFIFVHVAKENHAAKFELATEMIRKLLSFVIGECLTDNPDALNNHELLVPGQIMGAMLRERLEQMLQLMRGLMIKEARYKKYDEKFLGSGIDVQYLKKLIAKVPEIGLRMMYFLSTGNLVTESGLDQMQVSGYTVMAEKLNRFRYLSHFRAVHRGQFFTEMRTTAVRKLLPESWGFLCPVHTPDGTPCGLLNHLGIHAGVVNSGTSEADEDEIVALLAQFGMIVSWSMGGSTSLESLEEYDDLETVFLNGVVVGYASASLVEDIIIPTIRYLKVQGLNRKYDIYDNQSKESLPYLDPIALLNTPKKQKNPIPVHMEICYVKRTGKEEMLTSYPGLYLFSRAGRLIRPVVNLKFGKLELIGASGQIFMNIAVNKTDILEYETKNKKGEDNVFTHCEPFDASMLSLVASATPFSDYNQSPRNMYQCQMSKQTMGTPMHNFRHRWDNKIYRINTPQAPICHNSNQRNFALDEHPQGTNSVVAVISYTGYDMEDACIINQASINRGFKHGTVYKTVIVDLSEKTSMFFSNINTDPKTGKYTKCAPGLDTDGLPFIGSHIAASGAICASIDALTGRVSFEKNKSSEIAMVESVMILGNSVDVKQALLEKNHDSATVYKRLRLCSNVRKVLIKLRFNRNPQVGDKFASRAGQKGVMSIQWPQHDMPFTDSGITPDLIINPHAFPSRMTIGMLMESMGSKAGALHGKFQDSTPFRIQEGKSSDDKIEMIGSELIEKGFNFYGTETMYSGFLGTELEVDIYIGIVYYQRLRHMVSDKSQVRALGPIDGMTRQPVKGRKRMGGVRFGEMERDSLLSHGTSFLTQDRLLNSSDRHVAYVCCGSLLAAYKMKHASSVSATKYPSTVKCHLCKSTTSFRTIVIPYVFRYLINELAAMGIKWTLDF